MTKFNVAMIGLGFGAEFIPIYQAHPQANVYAICQRERGEAEQGRRPLRHRQAVHEATTTCSKIRRSISCTSTRRFPITRRCRSPRSRPAST